MMRKETVLLACWLLAGTAGAAELVLPGLHAGKPHRVDYRCGNTALRVDYLNTAAQSLALLEVHGQPMIFVSTPAASGVRYQAGRYVWWTKGDNGNLYDVMSGRHPEEVLSDCRAAPP